MNMPAGSKANGSPKRNVHWEETAGWSAPDNGEQRLRIQTSRGAGKVLNSRHGAHRENSRRCTRRAHWVTHKTLWRRTNGHLVDASERSPDVTPD